MKKGIIAIVVLSLSLGFAPQAVFGWGNYTTHPALTNNIVDLYNATSKQKITEEEKQLIIKGSIEEDTPPRWINHFYDPIYKQGWTGEKGPGNLSNNILLKFSDIFLSSEGPVSAINWVHNQKLQAKYKQYAGNKTWEYALYQYVKKNNEKEAFLALGHVLHLLEDMSVPEHTRNDTHALSNPSPMEDFAKRFTIDTFHIASNLKNAPIPSFDTLNDYFINLSKYSNNYFFSKDTINDPKYKKPKIEREESGFALGVDEKGELFKLARVDKYWNSDKNEYEVLYLLDKNEPSYYPILSDYWHRLSRAAILSGAGTLKLFFKQVNQAKENPELLKEPPKEKSSVFSAYGKIVKFKHTINHLQRQIVNGINKTQRQIIIGINTAKDAFLNTAKRIKTKLMAGPSKISQIVKNSLPTPPKPRPNTSETATTSQSYSNQFSATSKPINQPRHLSLFSPAETDTTSAPGADDKGKSKETKDNSVDLPSNQGTGFSTSTLAMAPTTSTSTAPGSGGEDSHKTNGPGVIEPRFSLPSGVSPGFGGGGSPSVLGCTDKNASNYNPQATKEDNSCLYPDIIPPPPPVILSPPDFSQTFTSSKIVFSGKAEELSTISTDFNSATSSVGADGLWSLELSLNEGTNILSFFSADASGNVSSSTTVSLFVDSEAPDVSLSISECSDSLSDEACLAATTTLNILWSSKTEDLSYFVINSNGSVSTTTATSTRVVVDDKSIFRFSVSAVDINGNQSATSTQEAEISLMPVVINEVAWAGTSASPHSPYDEWIELYNNTDREINLNGWVLRSEDNRPYIKLSKTIPAKGYYLLERTDDDTVSDIGADLIYGNDGPDWALNNTGEVLILSYASTTIDQTPSGNWPGGGCYYTMERYDPQDPGTDSSNWGTNNAIIRNGKDADGNGINGTPKARNSVNYLVAKGQSGISSDVVLTKENSPYVVNNTTQIFKASSTLTIEPGVVVKFYNGAGWRFTENSKITAKGTAEEPIVFTSFSDGDYGGDTNGDDTSISLAPGNWYGIKIEADGSVFKHAIFRYGGKPNILFCSSLLCLDKSSAGISHSSFLYSQNRGISLISSTSTIADSIFSGNLTGIYGDLGSSTIKANTFKNNFQGVEMVNTKSILEDNLFSSSTKAALALNGPVFAIARDNKGEGEAKILTGAEPKNQVLRLYANQLPYHITNAVFHIPASTTLEVERGTTVYLDNYIDVEGSFLAKGEEPGDILFISSAPGHNKDGIVFRPHSSSFISGATFSGFRTALSYDNSSINLSDVRFQDNRLAVYAVNSSASTTKAANIGFSGNTSTTTPPNLFDDYYQY